jgi:hypothetical protein
MEPAMAAQVLWPDFFVYIYIANRESPAAADLSQTISMK